MYVRLMQHRDIGQVAAIDREAFPTEWPPTNFKRELDNRMAYYIVVCEGEAPGNEIAKPRPEISVGFIDKVRRVLGFSEPAQPAAVEKEETVLGYAGIWIMADEAHITSIASRGQNRREGIGEALLIGIIELAGRHNARLVTLEVRVSNTVAQSLYIKYGFEKTGLRKGYYLDNREDAIIMSTGYIGEKLFRDHIGGLTKALDKKIGQVVFQI